MRVRVLARPSRGGREAGN